MAKAGCGRVGPTRCALLAAILGPAAARAGGRGTGDTTALLQHAVRAEHEADPLQRGLAPSAPLRNLTSEELRRALRHLSGLPLADAAAAARWLREPNCTGLGARAPCFRATAKRGHSAKEPDPNDEVRRLVVDTVATKLCTARFAAGYTVSDFYDYLVLDFIAPEEPYRPKVERVHARSEIEDHVDEEGRQVRLDFFGASSHQWKLVDQRYGCTLGADTDFQLATSYLPVMPDPSLPRRLPEQQRMQDDENLQRWAALDGNATGSGSPGKVQEAIDEMVEKTMGSIWTASVAVVHGGLLWERYADSASRETRQSMNSLGKSILSLLISELAGEQGFSLDEAAFVPEIDAFSAEDGVDYVGMWGYTLSNLLNMVVGNPPEELLFRAMMRSGDVKDTAAYAAGLGLRHPVSQGKYFYATGNYQILSRELRHRLLSRRDVHNETDRLLGEREYADFPWERLFRPIGADGVLCERDPAGNLLFGAFCWATLRDLLRLGLLVLSGGRGPTGEQVVPAEAVGSLLSDDTPGHGANGHYIRGWYRLDRLFFRKKCGAVLAAIGMGGQVVAVAPKHDLVVARTSWKASGISFGGFMDVGSSQGYLLELLDSIC